MLQVNHYDPLNRQREKQRARVQDDRDLAAGVLSVNEMSVHNGFFAAIDVSRARIRHRGRVVA